jgi:glycosyltransferase involved in cell wall biosynthesis
MDTQTVEQMLPGQRTQARGDEGPRVSIGIFAWNEEKVIAATLESLLGQNIFNEFGGRGWSCEIVCVVNGCTDGTPQIAEQVFSAHRASHPFGEAFTCRVANIKEPGKLNAWNHFVHSFSSPYASMLIMMDADISLHLADTLWRMIVALEKDPTAAISVDQPRKHVSLKKNRSPVDWFSIAMAGLTSAASGQLCGQLYCIRAGIARNIYLPKDLGACEDGFIKALVCTDFLSRPILPERIRRAEGAEHIFEAYTAPAAIFKNQKRQMIGQTVIHILVDQYLKSVAPPDGVSLALLLRKQDERDPLWLKRLIDAHLKRIRFWWRLYPGLLTQRFKHLRNLSLGKRILYFPVACASAGLAIFTSHAAWKSLKAGTTCYWPRATRRTPESGTALSPTQGNLNLSSTIEAPGSPGVPRSEAVSKCVL